MCYRSHSYCTFSLLTSVNPVKCVLIWPEISSLHTQLQDKRLLGPRRLPVDVLVHSPVSAGCIVFTPCMWPQTNSHCVRRRHYTHTLSHTHTPTHAHAHKHISDMCLSHLLCCGDDCDFFCSMGLVYQMPSTIMCTYQSYQSYQSYHDNRPRATDCVSVCISPGINPEWS